jgi:tungstate transport system substrate-binding protein
MLRRTFLVAGVLLGSMLTGLAQAADSNLIKLATTTSTDNSGLLKAILPGFEKASGYKVHVIAVGTGKALRMGQDGDVDVVLVHARSAEDKFISEGYGEKRYDVMYNDFVIVGPETDPAGIASANGIADVMKRIADSQSVFVSRGDDSGTHKKEKKLWQAAGIEPTGSWYREAGQGMGKVLQMASELEGYTMADRGTWLAYEGKVSSQLLFHGDKVLFNPYGIISLSKSRHPDLNHTGAQALIDWIISAEGQKLIGDFKVNGKQLFIPDAK